MFFYSKGWNTVGEKEVTILKKEVVSGKELNS